MTTESKASVEVSVEVNVCADDATGIKEYKVLSEDADSLASLSIVNVTLRKLSRQALGSAFA